MLMRQDDTHLRRWALQNLRKCALFGGGPDPALLESVNRWPLPLLLALASAAVGCVISPQPSPPEPSLDGDGIMFDGFASELDSNLIKIDAAPGTVDPARGVVRITNLATSALPNDVPVASDGSFSIAIDAQDGATLRFQVKDGDVRSQPIDFVANVAESRLEDVDFPLLDCITIAQGRWIDFQEVGGQSLVVISNECADAVSFDAPRLRRGTSPFSVMPSAAFTVESGESVSLAVSVFTGGSEREDVLLLKPALPAEGLFAVTLTLPDR